MTKTARCDHPPIFSVEQVASGWRVMVKELALEANDTKNDRGTIRATLSFWRGETLVYRDRVALTSARAVGNVLRALRKITKCRVPDAALLRSTRRCVADGKHRPTAPWIHPLGRRSVAVSARADNRCYFGRRSAAPSATRRADHGLGHLT